MNRADRDDFDGFIEDRKDHVYQVSYLGLRQRGDQP